MSKKEFPECNRRGDFLNENTCQCFSNRIKHEIEGVAQLETCQICPYKDMQDDPDLPVLQKMPGLGKMAGNFLKAVGKHVADGGKKVSEEEYESRLKECNTCVFLVNNSRCSHMNCGCSVARKAKWKSEDCPVGRWPKDKQ